MKKKNNNQSALPTHIDGDDMISYLDGEMERGVHSQIATHLESCWDCRCRLNNVERSIENFLALRQNELLPPELPPAGPALEMFRHRLSRHQTLVPSHSFFKLVLPNFRMRFRRIPAYLRLSNYHLGTQIILARATTAAVLVSIIAGVILFSGRLTTVSASELLRLSIDAQTERLNATDQPVLHQRIQIKQTQKDQSTDKAITWEIWNDTVNSRVKINSSPPAGTDGVVEADDPKSSHLQSILKANRMNEHRPLSAASYQAWTNSLADKSEEVIREADILTIHTVPNAPVENGNITEARFSVREGDYHPTELYIRTVDQEFDLIEQDFTVVSLKDIDPAIFVGSEPGAIATGFPIVPKTISSPAEPSSESPLQAASSESRLEEASGLTATTEAEVEVLSLLNKVGADISEQLNVTRTADGRLLVQGLVETDKRKSEIVQALSPVANNPAIRVKVQTIEEAARELAKHKQQSQPGTVDRVEVNKGSLAADPDLREHFTRQGGDTDDQIRRFASRSVNHSQAALFQASALNRLAKRFNAAQLRDLDPAARSKWLGILKGYASALRRETAALRGELQPVFGGMAGAAAGETISSDADLIATAKRLYELASANDSVVRSAFTLSSGTASVSAIKTDQFRRSLGQAEALAAAIERAR